MKFVFPWAIAIIQGKILFFLSNNLAQYAQKFTWKWLINCLSVIFSLLIFYISPWLVFLFITESLRLFFLPWWIDLFSAGEAHSLKVEKVLYKEKSKFQEVLVFEAWPSDFEKFLCCNLTFAVAVCALFLKTFLHLTFVSYLLS